MLYELDAKRAAEIRNVSVALVSSWTMDYVGPLEHAEWHYRSLVWAKCEAKDLHKVGRVPAGARWGRTFRIRCPTGAHSTYSNTVGDWWRRSLKWCLVIDLQTTRWWLNRSEAYPLTVVGGPKPPQRHWKELESRHYPPLPGVEHGRRLDGPPQYDWKQDRPSPYDWVEDGPPPYHGKPPLAFWSCFNLKSDSSRTLFETSGWSRFITL